MLIITSKLVAQGDVTGRQAFLQNFVVYANLDLQCCICSLAELIFNLGLCYIAGNHSAMFG